MSKKVLTLDIGAANAAMALYVGDGKSSLKLLKYAIAPLAAQLDETNAEAVLKPALQDLMRGVGVRSGDVAISVSGQMVFPRFAAIPKLGNDEKFEQQIRYEIEQNVPFPIDEMVCDRQVLGDTEAGDKSVMIVAAKLDQIEAITSAVSAAGLTPMIVDASPIAYTNAVRAAAGDDAGCVLLLDIGARTTSLIIAEGDKVYNRSIPIGGNNISREISHTFNCSPEDADALKFEKGYVSMGGTAEDEDEQADAVSKICRTVMTRLLAEVSRSVNFYRSQQGGSSPTRLYLTGGTSLLPQLDQFLADNLQVEVVYFDPSSVADIGSAANTERYPSDAPILSSTAGLALHALGAARFAINLLPPSIVAARAEKRKVPVVLAASVCLVLALGMMWQAERHSTEVKSDQLAGVRKGVTQLKGYESQVKGAQLEVDASQDAADQLKKLLFSRSAQVLALKAVRASLAPGMWIERWDSGKVTIRGWHDRMVALVEEDAAHNGGKRRTASEIVTAKLKGNVAIDADSVKISEMSSLGRNGEIDQFTVELKFK